jgi:putative spermidine/putrescine transport system ATP-binding protein
MSDRLAVFNRGKIEQIGAPADVYERPATQFVAGFVGTSNLLSGPAAQAIVGKDGTYTVRPEKIRLGGANETPADGQVAARGKIRKVVYLGSDTRYLVDLDAGSELTVVQQNLATSSSEALELEGKPVTLLWQRQHTLPVLEPGGQAPEEEGDPVV